VSRIPVALQLYTVREQLSQDPAGTIKAVAEIGYQGVEGMPPKGMSTQGFRSLLDDCGLKLLAIGGDPIGNLQGLIDDSRSLGCDTVMLGLGGVVRKHNGDWKKAVADLAEACAKGTEAGLILAYHNHAFEYETKVDGVYALDYIFNSIPAGQLEAELDVYWVKTGGEDPVAYVRKYAGRMRRLHLKDRSAPPADLDCPFAELGQGILDWDSIFAAAEEAGVQWYVVEQDRCTRPPLESARMSFEFLKARGIV
jgi:sugar phosphate isomerase/epimerase